MSGSLSGVGSGIAQTTVTQTFRPEQGAKDQSRQIEAHTQDNLNNVVARDNLDPFSGLKEVTAKADYSPANVDGDPDAKRGSIIDTIV